MTSTLIIDQILIGNQILSEPATGGPMNIRRQLEGVNAPGSQRGVLRRHGREFR